MTSDYKNYKNKSAESINPRKSVIQTMKKYDKYKPSGVEWIGEVPEHWEVKKLKYLDEITMGQSPNSEEYDFSENGIPFIQGNAEFGKLHPNPKIWCNTVNKFAFNNDVLLSVRAPIGAVNIADKKIGIGRGLCSIRPRLHHKKYLYYYILCSVEELNSIGTGSTYAAISTEEVKNFLSLCPIIDEQTAIANYLDEKTAKIDSLIEKKKKLVELYKEERAAIINQAVTKGLNCDSYDSDDYHDEERGNSGNHKNQINQKNHSADKRKLKPSGVEWLGDIPMHWEVKKLKYVAKLKSGESITSDNIRELDEFPVYGGNGLRGFTSKFTHDGDYVLIGRQGALCGNINFASGKFFASEHAVVVSRFNNEDILWLGELLRSMNLNQYSISAAQPGLSVERIQNLSIPYPSLDEQKEIGKHIEAETKRIDAKIAKTERLIKLLQEYRTALISELVTGKIDIRNEVQSDLN